MLIGVGLCCDVLVCVGMCRHVLVCVGVYVCVCCICWYVLVGVVRCW